MPHRYALLVGINDYPGSGQDLAGCVNDVMDMRAMLLGRGWDRDDIHLLTNRAAGKLAILAGLHRLLRAGKAGDELLFHYSGHGSQVPALDPDERDRLDEIICPWDCDRWWQNPLSDNVLRGIFSLQHPRANLTVILDCCHSGTATRDGCGSIRRRFLPVPPQANLPDAEAFRSRQVPVNRVGVRQDTEYRVSPLMRHILLAACRDDQTAADAEFSGRPNGAFTWALLQALPRCIADADAADIHHDITTILRENKFTQQPQLEGPSPLRQRPFLGGPFATEETRP